VIQCHWHRVGILVIVTKGNYPMVVNMYVGMTEVCMTRPHLVSKTNKMEMRPKNQKGAEAMSITREEYEQVMYNALLKGA